MTTDSTSVSTQPLAQYEPLLRYWILVLLMKCNGANRLLRNGRFSDKNVAEFIGLGLDDLENFSHVELLRKLTDSLEAAEAEAPEFPVDCVLARNLSNLAHRIGLSAVEADILHFVVLQRVHTDFDNALEMAGELNRAGFIRLLSACLRHPESQVQAALRSDGRLCRAAILSVDDSNRYQFGGKVDLLKGLADALMLEQADLLDLFAASFQVASPGQLTLDDYGHIADDIAVLKPYLEVACCTESRGVNVLIHGVPGTGKTEFAKALAASIGAKLMMVTVESPSGEPREGKERFKSLRFAQSVLAGVGHTLLLFDEVEDVFHESRGDGHFSGNPSGVKGWVNGVLERNGVPVIWITNCIEQIDPAYLRRFDYILAMEPPPPSVRRGILDKALADISLSEDWREAACTLEGMTAATLRRAVRVATVACDVDDSLDAESALSQTLGGTLAAFGLQPLRPELAKQLTGYRLDWVNADADLERLAEGLARHRSGRVCLWGPPGTGKSEYARYIAQRIGRPCLVRRASDILSPYVGVSERNIARMFQQASVEGAVLVLDEADSFLRERTGAKQGWEVTQVNEMLSAMESFHGIFVASTNLMSEVDQAALRRFDVCARLDFLKPHQLGELFVELTEALALNPAEADLRRVQKISHLTPGDFAAVRRGSKLCPPRTSMELIERLLAIANSKKMEGGRTIGFM